MAEIAQDSGGGGDKKVRSKKMSTRVDMTPMVDLGFLLITFFMLTTTLQKPVTMFLGMPDKTKDQKEVTPIKESEAITILLDKEKDKPEAFYWYQGTGKDVATTEVNKTTLAAKGGLRDVLRRKKAEIGEKFFVVVKATEGSIYKQLIDTLDELAITEVGTYGIADINSNDIKIIKKAEGK